MFISEKHTMLFKKAVGLQDGFPEKLGYGNEWHYPCVWEAAGKLYITYTSNRDESHLKRNLVISVIDLK